MDSLQESASPTQEPLATKRPDDLVLVEINRDSTTVIAQGRTEIAVLETFWAEARPLTLEQIRRATGFPLPVLEAAIDSLRDARMLRALNTLIESYVPSRPAAGG